MHIENSDALKDYLKNVLVKRGCAADPVALTRYIIALLRKKTVGEALKADLIDRLTVFLLHDTESFVDILLEALSSRSYIKPPPTNPERTSSLSLSKSDFVSPPPTEKSDNSMTYEENKGGESKRLCKNYVEKGFCLNGDFCDKSHGEDPVVVEDMSGFLYSHGLPVNTTASVCATPSVEGYDPNFPYFSEFPAPPRKKKRGQSVKSVSLPFTPKERTRELINLTYVETTSKKEDTHLKRKKNFMSNSHNSSKKLKSVSVCMKEKNSLNLIIKNVPLTLSSAVCRFKLQILFSKYGKTNVIVPFDGDSQTAKVKITPNSDIDTAYLYTNVKKDLHTNEYFQNAHVSLLNSGSESDKEKEKCFFENDKMLLCKNEAPHTPPPQKNTEKSSFTQSPFNSFSGVTDNKDKDKKKFLLMKANLQKQEKLIAISLQKQKILIQKLSSISNKDAADLIKRKISLLSSQTQNLQKNLRKATENFKILYLSNKLGKEEIAKLFLDVDLDMYKKEKNSLAPCSTSENLMSRVNLLKERAKAFVKEKSAILLKESLQQKPSNSEAVVVCTPADYLSKESVKDHFSQFGKIQNVTRGSERRTILIEFENKNDAEKALASHSDDCKINNTSYSLSSLYSKDTSCENEKIEVYDEVSNKDVPKFVDGDEDEEEEEDSEARSWKR